MSAKAGKSIEALKYPIGKFVRGTKASTAKRREECVLAIADFASDLVDEVEGLKDKQLDTPYRASGWTVRQLVHHLADSHSQTLHRFKLALTEEKPVIKPYKEALWAEHADARIAPVQASLAIILGSHYRWAILLRAMKAKEFDRVFVHPEQQREISLSEALELYVWHGKHHLAHITGLKKRKGW